MKFLLSIATIFGVASNYQVQSFSTQPLRAANTSPSTSSIKSSVSYDAMLTQSAASSSRCPFAALADKFNMPSTHLITSHDSINSQAPVIASPSTKLKHMVKLCSQLLVFKWIARLMSGQRHSNGVRLRKVRSLPYFGSLIRWYSGISTATRDTYYQFYPEMREKFGDFYKAGIPLYADGPRGLFAELGNIF